MSTEEIRRAVVTYQLSAKVMKKTAYIIDDGRRMVIPNLITVNRTKEKTSEDSSLGRNSFSNMGLEIINKDLEGYRNAALGTIVFNRTTVPKTRCEEFRSVAKINDGSLYRSKLDDFYIYKYIRDGESVAITLNQHTKSCGRKLYRMGIPNVHVLLVEEKEEFLDNRHLRLVEMEDDIMFESEIRGAMNSIELSVDKMYMDINFRACELARQNIITSQALLRVNLEVIRDRKGRALIPHDQGEAVML